MAPTKLQKKFAESFPTVYIIYDLTVILAKFKRRLANRFMDISGNFGVILV